MSFKNDTPPTLVMDGQSTMDITNFVSSRRADAFLLGHYNFYRAQSSRRLLTLRKKLGRTSKGKKYSGRSSVSARDIAENHEFAHLLLVTSERAWAHAMHMKSTNSGDNADQGTTGSSRRHIISRLHKASKYAQELLVALSDRSESGASESDILEARAYYSSLVGAVELEKQDWKACLSAYSEVRVIYATLFEISKRDVFKDQLSNTVDPTIRYAAYQLRLPRSRPIPALAREYFPRLDSELVSLVESLDPNALKDEVAKAKGESARESQNLAKTITWRSRTVDLEDAAIAQALASVDVASAALAAHLDSAVTEGSYEKENAAAYDDVLIASQDAVDATKRAIDELTAEGIGQGDNRMQALQITRTAVNYSLVSWRVGRNRVLAGAKDGALLESGAAAPPQKASKDDKERPQRTEGTGRKLARLRERVVLYDATLQSVDSIKELPGVAADRSFLQELQSKRDYFSALRCVAVARSHVALSNRKDALALFARALELSTSSLSSPSASTASQSAPPPNLDVSPEELNFLKDHLSSEVSRHRALVELDILNSRQAKGSHQSAVEVPLIESLETYSSGPKSHDNGTAVNLQNLVTYPPTRLQPVPVKPIFLDVAWNYVDYPGRAARDVVQHGKGASDANGDANGNANSSKSKGTEPPAQQSQKKGWSLFGR